MIERHSRDRLELKILKLEGNAFEDFFSEVMQLAYRNFRPVKAHGRHGDKGNDGWQKGSGTYYQVFAPEDLKKSTPRAIDKLKGDFDKLVEYWESISPIKAYYFVVNDKYRGLPPEIEKAMSELQDDYPNVKIDLFTASDLEDVVWSLRSHEIESVLGVSASDDDRYRVRNYLDSLNPALQELFEEGSEAGYFFPANAYHLIKEYFDDSNDWAYSRSLSSIHRVQDAQIDMRNCLIKLANIVTEDDHYELLPSQRTYKLLIPHDTRGRDQAIDDRRELVGGLIDELVRHYEYLRNYAI